MVIDDRIEQVIHLVQVLRWGHCRVTSILQPANQGSAQAAAIWATATRAAGALAEALRRSTLAMDTTAKMVKGANVFARQTRAAHSKGFHWGAANQARCPTESASSAPRAMPFRRNNFLLSMASFSGAITTHHCLDFLFQ